MLAVTFEVTGEAYDRFMGRYSRPLAGAFTDWLDVRTGERALDVGCGPGAWTEHLVQRLGADRVSAIDPSPTFVEACRSRFPGVDVREGSAEALPYDDDHFDVSGACLVVHFMTDPVLGLTELARVTRPGCWVGATVWDIAGRRAPMATIWSALDKVAPAEETESTAWAEGHLEELFERAGLHHVDGTELAVTVTHPSFDQWWEPYLHGVGPIGQTIAALDPERREQVRGHCHEQLGAGPFDLTAVAFAVRGRA